MQHILCSKERGKRFVAWLMTAIMLLFVMASALPAAQAVTQDEIDDMKSQASSLKEQQADLPERCLRPEVPAGREDQRTPGADCSL